MKSWGMIMTLKDTVYVFAILTAAYPYFYRDIRQDDEQMRVTISLWNEMLAEYDVETVKIALKRLIAIHKEYPPTIGQLLESISTVSGHTAPDADEIWGEIVTAIRDFGYYRTAEALESLSPLAYQAVKALDWYSLCKSESPETDRAHFLRIYQAIKVRNDQQYVLPKDVRAFIAAHTNDNHNFRISMNGSPACDVETPARQLTFAG